MSNDPVLDDLEAQLGRALGAWCLHLEEVAGVMPTEESVVAKLASVVQVLYLPPEERPDGTIDLAVRRARVRGEPLAEEPLPTVGFVQTLDASSVVDQRRIDRLVAVMGGNSADMIAEALRRGVASLEADHGVES
jgi:hypothetical protein